MKKYRMYQAPFMAFYSRDFYRDVALQWKGTGLAYLLLLLAVCWIPVSIKYQRAVSDFIDNKAPAIISQIPEIEISNGLARTAVVQPYTITDPDTGQSLAIIDTTGKTASLDGTEAGVLVTGTEVVYKKSDIETRTFSFKKVKEFALDKQRVQGWAKLFRDYSVALFFPFAIIASFVYRFVQLLIYAVIGILFSRLCKVKMSYETLVRLSAMAVTPAIIVDTIVETASIRIPLAGLLYFLLAMAYLFIGVKTASRAKGGDRTTGETTTQN